VFRSILQVPFGVRVVASGATGRADKLAQDAAGQLTGAVSQGVAPAHRPSNRREIITVRGQS
jgi:hypothetical protein